MIDELPKYGFAAVRALPSVITGGPNRTQPQSRSGVRQCSSYARFGGVIVIRKHDHAASISCHAEGSATPESETNLDHGCAGRFNVARLHRLEMLVGYELHVTRAEEYYASEDDPIDLPEWLAYAASNPGLAEAGSVDWAGIGRVPVFAYTLPTKHEVSLTWFEGRIDIKGVPDDRAALGLVHIAVDLKASLIGDDGERYIAEGIVPSG